MRLPQVHLIPLLQIQDGAQTCRYPTSVGCSNDKHAILHQVSCDQFVSIEDIRAELVGSALRGDEFPVIGVVGIVINVAASDVGDDLVELDDFFTTKVGMLSQTNHEVDT